MRREVVGQVFPGDSRPVEVKDRAEDFPQVGRGWLSGGPAVEPGLSPCGKDRLDQGPAGVGEVRGVRRSGSCPRTTMPGMQGIEGWRIRRFQSWSTPDGISVVPRH